MARSGGLRAGACSGSASDRQADAGINSEADLRNEDSWQRKIIMMAGIQKPVPDDLESLY